MLILALDTSTAAVTAGIARLTTDHTGLDLVHSTRALGNSVLASRVTRDARKHGEALAPAIRACLAEAGGVPQEVDAVIAGVGPGPFTGLRVGLATAAVFADAIGCPTYAVGSLDATALAALASISDAEPSSLLVASDARRKEIYWGVYQADGSRLTDPRVDRPQHVRAWLDGQAEAARYQATGAGAELYQEVLGLPIVRGAEPTIAALVALAAEQVLVGAASQTLTPQYLRRPDAIAGASTKAVV